MKVKALLSSRDWWIFWIFFGIVHLFYYPTWNAGFVTDFTGLADRIEGSNFWGIFNSFGFPALQQVLNFFLYLFYKGFGVSALPWYLVFTSMHALNAYCLFRFSHHLFTLVKLEKALPAALSGALFFLLLPYQSEVLTWRVCFNFLLSTSFIINALWNISRWFETGEKRYLYWNHALFILALFTFELSFTLPLIGGLYLLIWTFTMQETHLIKARLLRLSLPHFSLVGLYFILNRLLLGAWVGHYGASTHLRFDFFDILGNFFRYFFKSVAFLRYLKHPTKEQIFGLFDYKITLYVLGFVAICFLVEAIFRFKKLSTRTRLTLFFLLAFFAALVPVINLYFNYLLLIENDRYGYLASMFLGMFLALVFWGLPKWWAYSLSLAFLILSTFTLTQTNRFWKESTVVYHGLLESFDWYDAQKVYLLNLPDNLKGAVMFRDFSGTDLAFDHALRFVKRQAFEGEIREVALYNLTRPTNGVKVEQDSTQHLKVSFAQYGNWWWKNGQGVSTYEKEDFKFTNKGDHYLLELKKPEEEAIFLYQNGAHWEEFKLN